MKDNPFLASQYGILTYRGKSQTFIDTAHSQTPTFALNSSKQSQQSNPFQRNCLLPRSISKSHERQRALSYQKSSFQKKGNPGLKEKQYGWEKQSQIESHRRYIKAYGIEVMKYQRQKRESNIKYGNYEQTLTETEAKRHDRNRFKQSRESQQIRHTFGKIPTQQVPQYGLSYNLIKNSIPKHQRGLTEPASPYSSQSITHTFKESLKNSKKMKSFEESQLSDMLGSKLKKDRQCGYDNESNISQANSSMFDIENQLSEKQIRYESSIYENGQNLSKNQSNYSKNSMDFEADYRWPRQLRVGGNTFEHVNIT